MMKNLKKSEIIVYVVALMLVTAGYFNYTATDTNNLVETYSEDIQKIEDTANTGVGDAVLVSNNEIDSVEKKDDNNEKEIKSNEAEKKEDTVISDSGALVKNDNISEVDNKNEIINQATEKVENPTSIRR